MSCIDGPEKSPELSGHTYPHITGTAASGWNLQSHAHVVMCKAGSIPFETIHVRRSEAFGKGTLLDHTLCIELYL